MHGVKREKKDHSAEAKDARRQKEASKVEAYLQVENAVFALKKQDVKTEEALESTMKLLTLNPELYSIWNYRREILLALFDLPQPETSSKPDVFASLRKHQPPPVPSGSEQRQTQLLEIDLQLTEHALRAHPKVYWIWNHRLWCLRHLPHPDKWSHELALVDKMLQLDPRNFHGWNYRRFITSQIAETIAPSPQGSSFPASLSQGSKEHLDLAQKELQYTLRKIESNFSNFSAWHQRLQLLPRVWDAKEMDEQARSKARDDEFELVKQAMYTDPSDQSVWIYHRWLVEQAPRPNILEREIETIVELLELEPDSKWCMLSLAHHKTLLADATTGEQQTKLRAEISDLLHQLIQIDPDRANRYRDLLDGKAGF